MYKARNGDGSQWHDEASDKWKVEVSLPKSPEGKRRRTRRTFKTVSEATEGKRRLVAERDAGRLTEIRHETVAAYGIAWVRNVKALHVRPGTASDYEYRLRNNISPYLGSIKITELTTDAVEEWLATMRRGGKSAATINGARQVLMAVCKHALRNRVIPFNPVEPTSPVRRQPNDPTQVRQAWDLEEITRVLDCARDNDDLDAFLHLMLHLGLRPGEALALRWRDITADKTSLWVNGTLKEERRLLPNGQGVVRQVIAEPKTPASRRRLPIDDALQAALSRQRLRQDVYRTMHYGKWVETDHIVTTGYGTPVSASNLRRRFAKFLHSIDVRYIRFHDMRHSVATLVLGDANLPIEKASQALGHTRIDTTKQIYARHVPRYNDDFVEGIKRLLPKAPAPVAQKLMDASNEHP